MARFDRPIEPMTLGNMWELGAFRRGNQPKSRRMDFGKALNRPI
jgi:hypothetical protein